MKRYPLPALLWVVLISLETGGAIAAPGDPVDVAKIAPKCELPFEINKDGSACVANVAAFRAITAEPACDAVVGAAWNGAACLPDADSSKLPRPGCGTAIPNLVYNADKKNCQVVRDVPRSASGDYVGDCFKIVAAPPEGLVLNLEQNTHWKVMSQAPAGEKDKELVVAVAKPVGLFDLTVDCRETRGTAQRVRASSLVATGAHRYGWAYGVLALPFKYHRHDKSFTPGTLSVGPYLGRRWGSAGSAITAAATATIGSVRGEVRDAQDNITSTPDLTALSWALGVMFDVSKNPDLKPFKVGLFWGSDRVSESNALKYKHNRKPWVAFQIGFEFTDN